MANVKTYLNKILSAVYGKDVQGAIHDSIDSINEQVETTTAAENARVSAEKTRVSQENARKTAESGRSAAETARVNAEADRAKKETTRYHSENSRIASENKRVVAEKARESAETARINAEKARASAETSRTDGETKRSAAEEKRSSAENFRVKAETTRVSQEDTRKKNETTRTTQETSRQTTFTKLKSDIDTKLKQMDQAIQGSGSIVIDATLTQEEQAADAKVTGDRLSVALERTAVQSYDLTPASDSVTLMDGYSSLMTCGKVGVLRACGTIEKNTANKYGQLYLCKSPISSPIPIMTYALFFSLTDEGSFKIIPIVFENVDIYLEMPGRLTFPGQFLIDMVFVTEPAPPPVG